MTGLSPATRAAIAASRAGAASIVTGWRGGAACRAVVSALEDGEGAADAVAGRAEALLRDPAWLAPLLDPLLGALAADPWFEPPFRVHRDSTRIAAVLHDGPAATLTVGVARAAALAAQAPPDSVTFSGRITVTRYIRGGNAVLRRWRAGRLAPDRPAAQAPTCRERTPLRLRDGAVVRIDGRRAASIAVRPRSDMVTLVATVKAEADPLLREYGIADGRLRRVASADDRPSRAEMLLMLLRVGGRADAAARFAAASHDDSHQLRWAAMREWLMLDARAALPRLRAMADRDPHPDVRMAAAMTMARAEQRDRAPCHA